MNDFEDKIEAYCGDVREVVPELNGEFDRVIMPLPESAIDFLGLAVRKLSSKGKIYLYLFIDSNSLDSLVDCNEKFSLSWCESQCKVVNAVECGYRSSNEARCCIEIERV